MPYYRRGFGGGRRVVFSRATAAAFAAGARKASRRRY